MFSSLIPLEIRLNIFKPLSRPLLLLDLLQRISLLFRSSISKTLTSSRAQLKTLYESRGFSSKFLIYRELFTTTLAKINNLIEVYFTKIRRYIDQLTAKGLSILSKVIAVYILSNLTSKIRVRRSYYQLRNENLREQYRSIIAIQPSNRRVSTPIIPR